jgi:serine protease Do
MNPSISDNLNAVAEHLRRSTVAVRAPDGSAGSGVAWEKDGVVITNAHVATSRWAFIQTTDGDSFRGEVINRDERVDLAALRIDAKLPSTEIRDAATLRVGELVIAVGNPLGLISAVTSGIIQTAPSRTNARWIHADLRLAPGNSGGPLADAAGRIVGINSMMAPAGLALAVPSSAVRRFLGQKHDEGSGITLGVRVIPLALAADNSGSIGLLIAEMSAYSLAAASGLRVGDIITAVDRRPLERRDDLVRRLNEESSPGSIILQFIRSGRLLESTLSQKEPVPKTAA